ncbi:hypothetical protein [Actinophytocola sp.]|uniref:hypothetical protein n=1 Tax=Actinophytocola sp. TaxID=1872138 RepID=UPI00389AFCFB
MILSQLVDADELNSLSPEELREMLARLDDEVVYGAEGATAAAEEGETQPNNAK